MPRVDPRLLPDANAQAATNCKYERGNLEPLMALSPLTGQIKEGTKTLFHYLDQHWFSWNEEVDAVNSPIPQDPHQRVYITGMDVPRFTMQSIAIGAQLPNATRKLGVPKPSGGIAATAPNGGTEDIPNATDDETRFYTFTWVSDIGEEGPPADPSNSVVVYNPISDSVTLDLPILGVNDRGIVKRRIYRSATAGDISDWFLVAEIPAATTSYTDSKTSDELSISLITQNYFPPPDGMRGLTALANGVLMGFDGNILCPSEPNLPYAYNPNNQLACEWDIVAIGATPSGAVIATKGQPYLLQGYTPDSYQLIKLESSAPCVSARSLVDMGAVVIYASGEGLIAIGSGEPVVLTRSLMTKEQWQELSPESISAYQYGDNYVAFSDTAAFIIDQTGADITFLDISAKAGCRVPATESLVLAIDGKLQAFDAGAVPLHMQWKSKVFQSKPIALTAMKVRGHDVDVTVYRDGSAIHTHQIQSDSVFRLPSGYGSRWEVEVTGAGEVETIAMATSVAELM